MKNNKISYHTDKYKFFANSRNRKKKPIKMEDGSKPKKLDRRAFLISWLRTLLIAIAIFVTVIIGTIITLNRFTRHTERYELLDYRNLTVSEASKKSGEMNIRFEVVDSLYIESAAPGVILEQHPKPGSHIKSGRRVTVTTSTVAPRTVIIPYVTGYSLRQAQNTLAREGIGISKLIYVDDIATNNIVKQELDGRTITANSNIKAPIYSEVELYVGLGKNAPNLKVPLVIGTDLRTTKGSLIKDGLNVTIIKDNTIENSSIWNSVVYSQNPLPVDSVGYGSEVVLHITNDKEKAENFLRRYNSLSEVIIALKKEYKDLEEEINNEDISLINEDGVISAETTSTDTTSNEYAVFDIVSKKERYNMLRNMIDSTAIEIVELSNGNIKF